MMFRFEGKQLRLTTLNLEIDAPAAGDRYAPIYLPGTPDPQAASAVDVGSETDVGGKDFVLVRAATRRVRAPVVDDATGLPVQNSNVVLVPRNTSSGGSVVLFGPNDGVFESPDVFPGAYCLVATSRIDAGNNSFSVKGGRTAVDVADRDVDGVRVVVRPGVDIRGQVIVEGGQAPEAHPVVMLRSNQESDRSQVDAEFADNRQFVLDDVSEGDYRAQLTDLPKGTYAKSVRFAGSEVINTPFYGCALSKKTAPWQGCEARIPFQSWVSADHAFRVQASDLWSVGLCRRNLHIAPGVVDVELAPVRQRDRQAGGAAGAAL